MTVYIYTLSDPETGHIRYVGKTINLKRRLSGHIESSIRSSWRHKWVKSLTDKGLKPIMEVIEVINNSDDFDWQEAERFWISSLKFMGFRLCNANSGGEGGKLLSPEVKQKIGNANRGRKQPEWLLAKLSEIRKGKRPSAETRLKMSWSHTGRKHSEASIAKMRAVQSGRKYSAEARAARVGKHPSIESRLKMSKSHTGKVMPEATRVKVSLGLKGREVTPETRMKISIANTGRKRSNEQKEKLKTAWVVRKLKYGGIRYFRSLGIPSGLSRDEAENRTYHDAQFETERARQQFLEI